MPFKCSGWNVGLSAHRAGVSKQGIQRYSMTILHSITGTTNLTLDHDVTTLCHWHQDNAQTGGFSANLRHGIAEMVDHLCALSTERGHVPLSVPDGRWDCLPTGPVCANKAYNGIV